VDRPGRWLKLDRGKEHLKALNVELETIFPRDGPAIALTSAFDADHQAWVVRTEDIQRVESNTLGTLIGDVVQNLRAALDYLVWDLSILDSGSWPVDRKGRELRTQFPVCVKKTGPNGFDSPTVQTVLLDSISPSHKAEIERFQPYVTGDNTLVLLVKISNEDKHRIIQAVLETDLASSPLIMGKIDCDVVGSEGVLTVPYHRLPMIQGALKPNTEILRLPLANVGPHPHVDVIFEAAVFVAFKDGNTLGNFFAKAPQVVEEVLTAFEADLTIPKARQIRETADGAHLV